MFSFFFFFHTLKNKTNHNLKKEKSAMLRNVGRQNDFLPRVYLVKIDNFVLINSKTKEDLQAQKN